MLNTVESRFLEPPGETQIDSRNRDFEKSEVASNYAQLAWYCLFRSKCSNFNKSIPFFIDLDLCLQTKRTFKTFFKKNKSGT